VTLSERDKKILLVVVPLVALAGYWFLLLSPQRKEAARLGDEVATQEERRDKAESKLAELRGARATFASDYAALVKLGKAVPTKVDMPSVIVQLDRAAEGTGIRFSKIAQGGEEGGSGSPAPSPGQAQPPASPGGGANPPAAPGGTPAQSGPGQSAEKAGSNVNDANSGSGGGAGQPSGGSGSADGAGGGAAPGSGAAAGGAGTCPAGLECLPLQFEFRGGFFDLADFFHRLKRFVRVVNDGVRVRGRLLTVDSFKFASEQSFPRLTAEIGATLYLSPKRSGATAGASPQGPAGGTPAASSGQPGPAAPAATSSP